MRIGNPQRRPTGPSLQFNFLSVTNDATCLGETECPMGRRTCLVLNLSIGRKFGTALGTAPIRRPSDESGPHAFLAMRHFDEPAFKISNPARVTAFSIGPDRKLGEAKDFTQIITSNQYFGGITSITVEEA